jgi:hypothetical protein
MHEIISCPSCQRKLQVPESLLGQDVQCPTCGATFVGSPAGVSQAPPSARPAPYPQSRPGPGPRRDDYGPRGGYDDYDARERDRYWRGHRRDLMPHRGSAVLTLGILSLVICGIIFGPIAWVMGHTDLAEMRAGRMDPEGEGVTNAGKICGIIGTFLHGSITLIYLLIFLAAAGSAAAWR